MVTHQVAHAKQSQETASKRQPAPAQTTDFLILQRAVENPGLATPAALLALQRMAGNRAVTRLVQPLGRLRVQARLTVGPVGDYYEQEAERVAEQVMSAGQRSGGAGELGGAEKPSIQRAAPIEEEVQAKPLAASITPLVQRATPIEEEVQAKPLAASITPLVQRLAPIEEEVQASPLTPQAAALAQPLAQRGEAGSEIEQRLSGQRGGGRPLPDGVRAYMEPRFGADFGRVRLHTGSQAAQLSRALSAQAFTYGQDIYLGEGHDNPSSTAGQRLLAHELVHVVQQGAARPSVQSKVRPGVGRLSSSPAVVQRVVIPYMSVHRDWNLAEKQSRIDGTLGFSPPWLNGVQVTSEQATINALAKPQIKVTPKTGNFEAEVVSAPINIAGSDMWLPNAGPWEQRGANKDLMVSYCGARAKKSGGTITVRVSGVPNYKILAKQIEAHEKVHARDNARIIRQVLGRWDGSIHTAYENKIKFRGATAQAAEADLYRRVGGTANEIGTRLNDQWGQASDDYHATSEGKTLVENPILDEKRGVLTLVFRLTAQV